MRFVLTAVAALMIASPVMAQDFAGSAMIEMAISGNTVQGSMVSSGVYTEFYDADGTIKGDGYEGAWNVEDDKMCFQYGTDPKSCWDVRIDGDQVTWVQDGEELGTGTVVTGNPNEF